MKPYFSYLHLKEKIDVKKNIVAVYKLREEEGEGFREVAGGVAAESSVGTWTKVSTELAQVWKELHARVFEADKRTGLLKIAYPLELFEPGNIPQLLSSLAGNVFGLKEVKYLKLLDLKLPEKYVKSFPGPQIGAEEVQKTVSATDRPLIGSIIKPKLGLSASEHVGVVIETFKGGADFVKDDENLTDQEFNQFEERVKRILKRLASDLSLQSKIYAFNVTAPAELVNKRAQFVKTLGGNCVMIDFLTTGFGTLQSLREKNYGLIIHAHRAMHAALTRGSHGVSMLVLAKLARLAGVDTLHTGTVVGKMEGKKEEVIGVNKFLQSRWYGLKKVLPVASGGLYPGIVPQVIRLLGKRILLNFGGGIHGHPQGSRAGAKAVVQAVEAVRKGISLRNYAKNHEELKETLDLWGEG